MALKQWLTLAGMFLVIFASTPAIWWIGDSYASRHEANRTAAMLFYLSAIPLAAGMYWLTWRHVRKRGRALAAIVLSMMPLTAVLATVIAFASGSSVPVYALSVPFLGTSLGWQLAGGIGGRPLLTLGSNLESGSNG